MQAFLIINNVGEKINVDVNVKNWLTKKDMIKDLFGALVIVNMSVINCQLLWRIFTLWKL